ATNFTPTLSLNRRRISNLPAYSSLSSATILSEPFILSSTRLPGPTFPSPTTSPASPASSRLDEVKVDVSSTEDPETFLESKANLGKASSIVIEKYLRPRLANGYPPW